MTELEALRARIDVLTDEAETIAAGIDHVGDDEADRLCERQRDIAGELIRLHLMLMAPSTDRPN
jgi:hypothetical protein